MTFSVMGYDPNNGDVGLVVSTWALAVGSRMRLEECRQGLVAAFQQLPAG